MREKSSDQKLKNLRTHADDERTWEVGQTYCTWEVPEQCRATGDKARERRCYGKVWFLDPKTGVGGVGQLSEDVVDRKRKFQFGQQLFNAEFLQEENSSAAGCPARAQPGASDRSCQTGISGQSAER